MNALDPGKVHELVAKAREGIPKAGLSPAMEGLAGIGLDAVGRNAQEVATLGTDVAVVALSWWTAANPFSDPPELVKGEGKAAGLAALEGATDALLAIEDRKRAALAQLKRTALKVGLDAMAAAIPFLLRAILKSRDADRALNG